jgi:hypothetical protein
MTSQRACAESTLARIEVGEQVAAIVHDRQRHLLLNHRLARRPVDAHLDWLHEVEREPGAPAAHQRQSTETSSIDSEKPFSVS